ncbi:MAG: hypothetical protein ACRDRK_26935 [Pseudonocardia sp.]
MPPSIPPDHDPHDPQQPDWPRALVDLLARTLHSPNPTDHERAVALLRAVVLPLAAIAVATALVVLLVVVTMA